jgi:predicted nucleic acid-binding protein
MSRLRIVLDTNVLISAALKPSGQQAQVMELMELFARSICSFLKQ